MILWFPKFEQLSAVTNQFNFQYIFSNMRNFDITLLMTVLLKTDIGEQRSEKLSVTTLQPTSF